MSTPEQIAGRPHRQALTDQETLAFELRLDAVAAECHRLEIKIWNREWAHGNHGDAPDRPIPRKHLVP